MTHGGSAPQARKAAALRLLALADPAITALARVVRDDNTSDADRIRAATAILDRAGLGPQARISLEDEKWRDLVVGVYGEAPTGMRAPGEDRYDEPAYEDDDSD